MSTPVETGPAIERECPRCGSPAVPPQEYCLECGARLPADPAVGARRGAGGATWPVLVSGVIALLAAALVVVVQLTTDEERPDLVVATTEQPPLPEPTAPPEPVPTTAPEPTIPPPTQTRPQPPPQSRVVAWPEGRRGWTVVIASLPESQGRQAATAKAREALDAGLPQAGVLVSSQFSSLHPGYLVVFSGVFDARGPSEQRASQARARGYGTAYTREIAP